MNKNFSEAILLCCLFIGALFSRSSLAENGIAPNRPQQCRASREFITTLEYLREQKSLGLSESESQKIADKVSFGCTGAAVRFIKTYETLSRADAGSRLSLQLGIEMAQKTDAHAETFTAVFRQSFLSSQLDLDLKSSLQMARMLAFDYKGDVGMAAKDFKGLVQFCLDESKVGLSIPRCAQLAGRVAFNGEQYPEGITSEFIRFYSFLRNDPHLSMAIGEALELAEEITSQSPVAAENFRLAYKYAINDKGLQLPANGSLALARNLAARSRPTTPSGQMERWPASSDSQPKINPKRPN